MEHKIENKGNGIVVPSELVKPLVLDETYSSKMLLDNVIAGGETVQINEGTLKAGCRTGGGVHEKNEVYYIVSGEAELYLNDERHDVKAGAVAFIPGGVFHYLVNKSDVNDLVILTFWMRAEDNDVYNLRVEKWGKSFKTIYED